MSQKLEHNETKLNYKFLSGPSNFVRVECGIVKSSSNFYYNPNIFRFAMMNHQDFTYLLKMNIFFMKALNRNLFSTNTFKINRFFSYLLDNQYFCIRSDKS